MASINLVTLLGRVGKDPELKTTDRAKVCGFSLATSETYKDKSGEKREETQWHAIVAFGQTAELVAQYVSKGDQVFIIGKIQYRDWTDKDGNKKYMTQIVVDKITFLGGKKKSDTMDTPPAPIDQQSDLDSDGNELPF